MLKSGIFPGPLVSLARERGCCAFAFANSVNIHHTYETIMTMATATTTTLAGSGSLLSRILGMFGILIPPPPLPFPQPQATLIIMFHRAEKRHFRPPLLLSIRHLLLLLRSPNKPLHYPPPLLCNGSSNSRRW